MTRARALLLSGLAFGLGSVATGGLDLLDSRYALLGAAGCAVVLVIALVDETFKRADAAAEIAVLKQDLAALRRSFAAMQAHLVELEVILMTMKTAADAALRARGSSPDLGAAGAEGSGRNRAL